MKDRLPIYLYETAHLYSYSKQELEPKPPFGRTCVKVHQFTNRTPKKSKRRKHK